MLSLEQVSGYSRADGWNIVAPSSGPRTRASDKPDRTVKDQASSIPGLILPFRASDGNEARTSLARLAVQAGNANGETRQQMMRSSSLDAHAGGSSLRSSGSSGSSRCTAAEPSVHETCTSGSDSGDDDGEDAAVSGREYHEEKSETDAAAAGRTTAWMPQVSDVASASDIPRLDCFRGR